MIEKNVNPVRLLELAYVCMCIGRSRYCLLRAARESRIKWTEMGVQIAVATFVLFFVPFFLSVLVLVDSPPSLVAAMEAVQYSCVSPER